jgi:hypothetical protein
VKRAGEFTTALRFAGLAALSAIVALVALEPWVGAGRARALFALALLPIAGARLAESLGPRVRVGLALALASLALAISHLPWPELALPLAGAFGGARALCGRSPSSARALALEVGLLGGGLALGALCDGRSTLSFGMAIWAFLLAQAAFPLFESGARPSSSESGDPFERARDQALALLEEDPR